MPLFALAPPSVLLPILILPRRYAPPATCNRRSALTVYSPAVPVLTPATGIRDVVSTDHTPGVRTRMVEVETSGGKYSGPFANRYNGRTPVGVGSLVGSNEYCPVVGMVNV
jgi:hypothetical protein